MAKHQNVFGNLAAAQQRGDAVFSGLVRLCAVGALALLCAVIVLLFVDARESIGRFGFSFLVNSKWDPVFEEFGAAAYVYGTLVTSFVAILLAAPIAIGSAVFVTEYAPRQIREVYSFVVEMLAVVPSIIFGLWAFFVLAPFMRHVVEPALKTTLGQVPILGVLFSGPILGKDLLIGGIILAVMILPTVMSVSREIILAVPPIQREGMLALGATKREMIFSAVLPYARAGLFGAVILGLARAFGETMAVTMVIGNSSTRISPSLFTPGYTMASAIANQFTEADTAIYFSAIVEVALVLLLVATIVNTLARLLVWRIVRGPRGGVRV